MKRAIVTSIIIVLILVASIIVIRESREKQEKELLAPSDLHIAELLDGSNLLTWTEIDGANGYQIFLSSTKDGEFEQIGSSTGSFYMNNVKDDGQNYFYYVKTMQLINGKEVISEPSNTVSLSDEVPAEVSPSVAPEVTDAPKATEVPEPVKEEQKKEVPKTDVPKATEIPKVTDIPKTDTSKVDDNVIETSAPAEVITPASKVESAKTTSLEGYRTAILRLVNEERKSVSIVGLKLEENLTTLADVRAEEISRSFSHTRPNGTQWSTIVSDLAGLRYAGENLAYGYENPADLVDAWMKSEGHRENILNMHFKNLGIGLYEIDDVIYATQLFTN